MELHGALRALRSVWGGGECRGGGAVLARYVWPQSAHSHLGLPLVLEVLDRVDGVRTCQGHLDLGR